MKKYRLDIEIMKGIARLLADTAVANMSSSSQREFIQKLSLLNTPEPGFVEYADNILDSIVRMIETNSHREIFVFNGQSQSGVSVVELKELPSTGYCFFGWIRVERKDQSSFTDSANDFPMCIYRLATKGEQEIKLYIDSNMHLCYYVSTIHSGKPKEKGSHLQLTTQPLSQDFWYFIELYHLNSAPPSIPQVQCLVECAEICKLPYKQYAPNLCYSENSVGCEIVSKPTFLDGEPVLKCNFRGETSAFHFASIKAENIPTTRSVLSKVNRFVSMHELFPILAFGENRCNNRPRLLRRTSYLELEQSTLLERIFLVINPKYARKAPSEPEKIYTYKRHDKILDLYNHTEDIYKHAKVHHNYPAKDVLFNIGGIKCLLPILHELADMISNTPELVKKRNEMVIKILQMMRDLSIIDREKCSLFYESDDGIMMISYLLGRIATKSGLSATIYDLLCQILDILLQFYSNSAQKFIELVYLNMEIWKYSSEDVQYQIAEKVRETYSLEHINKQGNSHTIIDSLLRCIEVFISLEPRNEVLIQKYTDIILQISKNHMITETVATIISHANLYSLRRLMNYPLQIYYIFSIFCELYYTRREKMQIIIKEFIKIKKDSKVICTIFSIFDYFTFVKEYGFKTEYTGLSYVTDNSGEGIDEGGSESAITVFKLPEKKSDTYSLLEETLSAFLNSKDGESIIDQIVAMSMHWILSFEWNILAEYAKEFSKEDMSKRIGNIVGYIIKSFGRITVPAKSKKQLLYYIFNGNDQRHREIFGINCYLALKSIILGTPFRVGKINSAVCEEEPSTPKFKILAQPVILEGLLENLYLFNGEARRECFKDFEEMCKDKRLLSEIIESDNLINSIFALKEFEECNESVVKLQQELLCFMVQKQSHSADFARICATLPCQSDHQLKLLDSVLDFCIQNLVKSQEPSLPGALLQIAYALEDAVIKDPEKSLNPPDLIIAVISKLLYLLKKTKLMYISLPIMTLFDERGARDVGALVESDILRIFKILL